MARSNARTAKCFNAAMGLSAKDIAKLDKAAEQYNTGDIAADYAAAVQDELHRLHQIQQAVQTALVEKTKAAPTQSAEPVTTPTWGTRHDRVEMGDYAGPATAVEDRTRFATEHPGYTTALNQLEAAGFPGLADHVDAIWIAEGNFKADGALNWNPRTGQLELWLSRTALENENRTAFTVRHEMGHLIDGAFGPTGTQEHSGALTPALLQEGEIAAQGDSAVADALHYAYEYADDTRRREELFAQLFAVATGRAGASILPHGLVKFISGALDAAKTRTDASIRAARIAAEAEYQRLRSEAANPRRAQAGTQGDAQGQLRQPVRAQRLQPVTLSRQITDVARQVAGPSGAHIVHTTLRGVQKLATSMEFLHDIVERVKSTLPAAQGWYDAMMQAADARRSYEMEAEAIATQASQLPEGAQRINDFISRSTFEQKWGYDPKIAGKTVTVDPAMRVMYNALSAPERKVVEAVFAYGDRMLAEKRKILKLLGLDGVKEFAGTGQLDGPYAPLKRFGDHVVVLKSRELRAAELSENQHLIDALKENPEHYVVTSFDTNAAAANFAHYNNVANGGKWEHTDSFERSENIDRYRTMPMNVLQRVDAAIDKTLNIPAEFKKAARDMVQDMYFASLDEHNARLSGLRRKNRAGYDADMMRSFLAHARAEAGFLANMRYGGEISARFYEMQGQIKDRPSGLRVNQDDFNTLAAHYAQSFNTKPTPWQDAIMAGTSAFQLATSLGYHLTNATQGLMVSLPRLAADFNSYGGAWKAMMDGYAQVNRAGWGTNFDVEQIQNQGLREALQAAQRRGLLDVGMMEDLTHLDAFRTGLSGVDTASGVVRSALHKLRQISRSVEIVNRVASATAGYNMAMARPGATQQAAQAYVIRLLETTQGDSSRIGAPLLLKKLPKFMTQYKKYQLTMAALYVKAFRNLLAGESPEVRAIARRFLAYKLFHTSMAAGVLGLPMINLVAAGFGMMGGDDEPPKDLERTLKDAGVPQWMLHGPLEYIGLDRKLGEDKIFSVLPYGNWDFTSKQGAVNTVAGLLGPAVSLGAQFADGIGRMLHGDYYKGVEKFMPKGVADAMKAARIANEGYTLKNGAVMVTPEDARSLQLVMDAVGLASPEIKHLDWLRNQQYEVNDFYQKRERDLEHRYVEAVRSGSDKRAELMEQWTALQASKNQLRPLFNDQPKALKVHPLSTLIRAPMNRDKSDRLLQSEVTD